MDESRPQTSLTPDAVSRAATLLLVGGRLCLDFCNTSERNPRDPHEYIPTLDALLSWGVHAGAITAEDAATRDPDHEAAALAEAYRLRDVLYRIFTALLAAQVPAPDDLRLLTRDVQLAHFQRVLVEDGARLRWEWKQVSGVRRLLAAVTLSAAELLTDPAVQHVRQCPGCGWLFIDESRKGNRVWCDMRACGNRAKARRYYQRLKRGQTGK